MLRRFAIVDIETTGQVPANGDRMIQLAIVMIEDGQIGETFTTFVNPQQPIPYFIQELTSITNEDVADAKPFEFYAQRVYNMLQGAIFVAHNVDFDFNFLQGEFKRVGLPPLFCQTIDTVELAKVLYPTAISYQLADIAADLQIEMGNAHRADVDALATARFLLKAWEKVQSLPHLTVQALHKHSFYLKSDVAQFMFEALKRKRAVIDQHKRVYRQIALREEQSQQVLMHAFHYPQTNEQKEALFKEALPQFETRYEQFNMMDSVHEATIQRREIAIEASTGIGKTMAYLVPTLHYALAHQQKVIVSTYTTNLMEQILSEEVPVIERIIGQSLAVAHVKGMNHFIDLDLFANYCELPHQSYDELLVRLQILVWLTETETGDLDELTVTGGGMNFIEKIQTSSSTNKKANYYFYNKALEKAQHATLIITNHAMLLADQQRKKPIFPSACAIVIDEAHQMVKAMTDAQSHQFTYNRFKYLIGQIGLYPDGHLFTRLQKATERTAQLSLRPLYILESNLKEVLQLFDRCMVQLVTTIKQQTNVQQPKQSRFVRQCVYERELFQQFSTKLHAVVEQSEVAVDKLSKARLKELRAEDQLLITEWRLMLEQLKTFHIMWDRVFLTEAMDFATWIDYDVRSLPSSLQFHQKPVQVQIAQHEIATSGALIWTSGTLTVPQQERFILRQLGVNDNVPLIRYEAPSSYYQGAKAFVVTDMPDIQAVSQQDYIVAVADAIVQTARAVEGRTIVLFTSHQMLRETAELITDSNLLADYMLFAQGVTAGSRMKLLKAFQKFNKSILFGTNSFWEGVDVPGDGLAAVIVVRLPFTSPDEPTFKAKSLAMQQHGINPFQQLSLPEAILRFKQGFGRLIRSSKDKGVFIVLDKRIEKKSYGAEFLDALPSISVRKQTLAHMVNELEHWYNNER